MLVERIVAKGLAHISYIIGAGGKAAVIDPRRDCGIYLEIASRNNLIITHIFETHRNEDYVVGSRDLAARCGAGIYHGAAMDFAYGTSVREGDTFAFGPVTLKVLETPGHTEESISLVLSDQDAWESPFMVFCGDTLFCGDIARTDFFGDERKAEMAGKIYDSITSRILSLGDGIVICPAHGAGSVCGGGEITDHPFSTAGYEKTTNEYLLMGRDQFIARRISESPYVPPYFHEMERYNKKGAPLLSHLPAARPLTVPEVNRLQASGCQILDIRAPTSFGAGHIPGSISIWRDGISSFAGWYLAYDSPIIVIDDSNKDIGEVIRQMVRLGYDDIAGFLAGGFPTWFKSGIDFDSIPTCSVQQLNDRLQNTSPFLLDVRDIKNRKTVGHIRNSHHIYAGEIPAHIREVPKDKPVYIYCDAGYKGSLAASILARHGHRNITNVLGGMTGWIRAGFNVVH